MKNIKKCDRNLIGAGVVLLLFLVLLGHYLWIGQGLQYSYSNYYPLVNEHELVELDEGTTIIQEFVSDNIHLKGLQYYLLDTDVAGQLHIEISDDKRVVAEQEIEFSKMSNAEWYYDFFYLKLKRNQVYNIKIYAEKCEENKYPYMIIINQEDACKESRQCYINGDKVEGALFISYNFAKLESDYVNASIFMLALFCSLVIMLLLYKYYYPNKCKEIYEWKTVYKIKKILVVLMFVCQFLLVIPNIVYRLGELNLDPSWRYFLNIANDLGLKYGKDIYFTYGPLGYICYLMNLGNSGGYWLGIFIWIVIFAAHITLLYWLYRLYEKKKVSFTAIVLSFLCYVTVFTESERDNYQLYLLILSVIIYYLGNKKSLIFSNMLLMLMFFCKFSTFTSGIAFITIFVVLQVIFNKDKTSIFLMLPALAGAPVAYLCYNPSLKGMYEYVTGILRISSGWMKTQQWDDAFTAKEYRAFFLIVLLYVILIAVVLFIDYHKSTVLIACSASLFFAYKYAVTAHGIAMGIWLTALLFSEVMLTIDFYGIAHKINEKKKYIYLYATALVASCGIAALQAVCLHNDFGQLKASLNGKIKTFASLNESSLMPELYETTYIPQNILDMIADSTVTIYPWEVGYKAVYTDLNMVYTPSIQNCNEFIPWLDQKVADYFYSEKAPEYIILEDETIYFHIKYLDNPLTWEAIKDEYGATVTQEGFCLLKKRDQSMKRELELIKTEERKLSEPIICPDDADYVKINLEYSALGSIQEFLWRSGMTNMAIRYEDDVENRGVVIVPNMPSGFSLDYVPQNIEDVSAVLNGNETRKMKSLEFFGIGLKVLKENVKVEWYKYNE
ncbi:hypothetical protein [Thomasclavelia cocleata]|uniref:hypothetical protein n=1 Tax=Thomasclavelia cocleata TaxID=69824 RepID=UPI00255AC883|nr:hypothetical protein [Thomasclavelia cocleata]